MTLADTGSTCSASSLTAGEPLIGSAPQAAAWLCLEQPGPWGRKAFTQSHLDPALGERIEKLAATYDVRPALIRRPGRHADAHTGGRRTVLAARPTPDGAELLSGVLDDPEELLDLDWEELLAGGPAHPALRPTPDPHLLVCTNGRRDTCCARLGRPVALAAAARHPGRVWEVTHTSGHRFAPTTVLLPSGDLHGRVLDAAGLLELATAGRLALDGWRGRSTWPGAGQAAAEAVRRRVGVHGLDDLVACEPTAEAADGTTWRVRHRDGRDWTVAVTVTTGTEQRAESCGKAERPVTRYVAGSPVPL